MKQLRFSPEGTELCWDEATLTISYRISCPVCGSDHLFLSDGCHGDGRSEMYGDAACLFCGKRLHVCTSCNPATGELRINVHEYNPELDAYIFRAVRS